MYVWFLLPTYPKSFSPTLNIKMVFGEKLPKMGTFSDFVTISLLNVITKFKHFPTYLPLILSVCNRNHTYISFRPYSIVNYSMNLPHISSSHCNRLAQRAINLDIDLIHTLCFCLT